MATHPTEATSDRLTTPPFYLFWYHAHRGKAGQRHNTGHRSTVQMSRLRVTAKVADSFVKRIRKLVTG